MNAEKEQPKTNVAKRIREVLSRAKSFEVKRTVLQAWTSALASEGTSASDSARLVTQRLGYVLDSIDQMEALLRLGSTHLDHRTLDKPIEEWKSAIQKCLLNLQTPWASCKEDFKPHMYTALDFWCCILPDSETTLPTEELRGLASTLRRALDELSRTDLTPQFVALVKRHLHAVLAALDEYVIRGGAALRSALRDVGADLAEHSDDVRDNASAAGMSVVADAWGEILRVTQPVRNSDALLYAMYEMNGMAGQVLRLVAPVAGRE